MEAEGSTMFSRSDKYLIMSIMAEQSAGDIEYGEEISLYVDALIETIPFGFDFTKVGANLDWVTKAINQIIYDFHEFSFKQIFGESPTNEVDLKILNNAVENFPKTNGDVYSNLVQSVLTTAAYLININELLPNAKALSELSEESISAEWEKLNKEIHD